MKSQRAGSRWGRGVTVVELLVAVVIVGVLASVAVIGFGRYKERSEKLVCIANMKSLHLALSSYTQEHDFKWPQPPEVILDREETLSRWWQESLNPYGMERKAWLCPTDVRLEGGDTAISEWYSSYIPTQFGPQRHQAFRFPNQPWAIERGVFHEEGLHVLYQSGEVKPLQLGGFIK